MSLPIQPPTTPVQPWAPYGPPPPPPAAYPPPPAPARRRTGLVVGVIVGVVVLLAGVVVGGLLLFGRSSLNTAELQKDITQLTQEKAGVAATDVSCPEREMKAGDRFTCTAQLEGQSAHFTVEQRDDKGNVHIQLDDTLVVVSQLEGLLTKQVANDVGFQVTSSCEAGGRSVLVDGVGKPVRCTVSDLSDPSNSIVVTATVDEQGHVSYQEA